jgi:tripartite-type tricarboxylate transporter receptor subunit TctC
VISLKRDPTAPHIPTVNEGKYVSGVEADLWTGLFAPAGLPAELLASLSAALNVTLKDAQYQKGEFLAGSVTAEPGEPAAFKKFLQAEEARLKPILASLKAE